MLRIPVAGGAESAEVWGNTTVELHWYEKAGIVLEPKVKFPEFNISIPFRLPFP